MLTEVVPAEDAPTEDVDTGVDLEDAEDIGDAGPCVSSKPLIRINSARRSAADAYRSSRSFSSSLPMLRSSSAGTCRFRSQTGCGVLFNRASKMMGGVGPSNGRDPVTISYRTTPNDHRSLRASTLCPRACSGDM